MRKKIEKSDTRLPNTFRQTEPDIRAYTVKWSMNRAEAASPKRSPSTASEGVIARLSWIKMR